MAQKQDTNTPGWFSLKKIIPVLSLLIGGTLGGGIGYQTKEAPTEVIEKPVVVATDMKEFAKSLYENLQLIVIHQSEKDRNQNDRIDQVFDEMRTFISDFSSQVRTMKRDIRDIKTCLEEKEILLSQEN